MRNANQLKRTTPPRIAVEMTRVRESDGLVLVRRALLGCEAISNDDVEGGRVDNIEVGAEPLMTSK